MNFLVSGEFAGGGGALWLGVLLDMTLKGTLLLAVTLGLTRLLRRDVPARRSRIWLASFALLVLLPLVSLAMQRAGGHIDTLLPWHALRPVVTVTQAERAAIPHFDSETTETMAADPTAGTVGTALRGHAAAVPNFALPAPWVFAVLLWLGGAAIFVTGLLRRYRAGRAIARRAEACDDEALLALAPGCSIVFSDESDVPFLTGLREYHLVLPGRVRRWPRQRLAPIVLHEMAHLRRRDLPRLILGDVVCSLYWFQPLVWLAARRSHLDLELACDQDVCASGVRGPDYARLLLAFAAGHVPGTAHGLGFARASNIEVRMRQALRPHVRTRRLAPAVSTVGAVAALVLLTSVFVEPLAETPAAAAPPALPTAEPLSGPSSPEAGKIRMSIHDAARDGDTDAVMAIIAQRPSLLNAPDDDGMTPLALAAWNDQAALVAELLAHGADPNLRNANGLTPLFCALDRGRRSIAEMLIGGGARLDQRGFQGRSLLHMAARAGYGGIVETLLSRGADLNAADARGVTPLDLAAWGRHVELARRLAALGAEASGLENPHGKMQLKKDIYLTPEAVSLILK